MQLSSHLRQNHRVPLHFFLSFFSSTYIASSPSPPFPFLTLEVCPQDCVNPSLRNPERQQCPLCPRPFLTPACFTFLCPLHWQKPHLKSQLTLKYLPSCLRGLKKTPKAIISSKTALSFADPPLPRHPLSLAIYIFLFPFSLLRKKLIAGCFYNRSQN